MKEGEVFQFPGTEKPKQRDARAEPLPGDVWVRKGRYRTFGELQCRVECHPYDSYGRVLTHKYLNRPNYELQQKWKQLPMVGIEKPPEFVVQFVRLKLSPHANGSMWETSKGRCSQEKWAEWLDGAELHREMPESARAVNRYRGWGALSASKDGLVETVRFEWGRFVCKPESSPGKVRVDVYIGGTGVLSLSRQNRNGWIGPAWGTAQGLMFALTMSPAEQLVLRDAVKAGNLHKLTPKR